MMVTYYGPYPLTCQVLKALAGDCEPTGLALCLVIKLSLQVSHLNKAKPIEYAPAHMLHTIVTNRSVKYDGCQQPA
eukprot:662588-Prorocentrum_minimum.AAC.1